MTWRDGQHVGLIFALLVSVAGIVKPSAGLFAATALLVFAALVISVASAYNDWADGYFAASREAAWLRPEDWDDGEGWANKSDDKIAVYPVSYKCGMSSCPCSADSRFLAGDV